jgi:hypothetical protein
MRFEFVRYVLLNSGLGLFNIPVPGVLSPGVKRGRGVTLTTHPHLLPRS